MSLKHLSTKFYYFKNNYVQFVMMSMIMIMMNGSNVVTNNQVLSFRTNFYLIVSNIERMFKCIDGILSLSVSSLLLLLTIIILIYVLVVINNYNCDHDNVIVLRYYYYYYHYKCNNSIVIYSTCRSLILGIFNVRYYISN